MLSAPQLLGGGDLKFYTLKLFFLYDNVDMMVGCIWNTELYCSDNDVGLVVASCVVLCCVRAQCFQHTYAITQAQITCHRGNSHDGTPTQDVCCVKSF